MKTEWSEFAKRFGEETGIGRLMGDLGKAMAGSDMLMLGGGNPGRIPEVDKVLRQKVQSLLDTPGAMEHALGDYVSPQGDERFIKAVVNLFKQEFSWPLSERNVLVCNGSQTGFFMLLNMFAGRCGDGIKKKILFPLCPEYIGYADIGLEDDFFVANKPEIEFIDEHTFKYRVNFKTLEIGSDIGAICLSRPTNPTGNVVSDDELTHLRALAKEHHIPLIVDSAYGTPFPNVIFTEATPMWDEHMVVSMSLSKVGLPGARTGLIIASEEIIDVLSQMNAVISLAPNSLGSSIACDLFESGEITRLSREVIHPYYLEKSQLAYQQFVLGLKDLDVFLHKPEGSMYLWVWMRGLPISDHELYERLKKRSVLVVAGQHFFSGCDPDWKHAKECIRVTFTQETMVVKKGINIICEEIRLAYQG